MSSNQTCWWVSQGSSPCLPTVPGPKEIVLVKHIGTGGNCHGDFKVEMPFPTQAVGPGGPGAEAWRWSPC